MGLHWLKDVQSLLPCAPGESNARGTTWWVRSNTFKPQTDLLSALALKKAPSIVFLIHQESPRSHSAWWPPCSLWPETEPPQLLLSSTHAFMLGPARKCTLLPSPSPPQDIPPPASTLSLTVLILLYPFHLRGLNVL